MSFVDLRDISKSYGKQTVLDRVSLSLQKGEFATLLGQSGCGKSTLLRVVAGLVPVDEGRISIDGRDITRLEPRRREVGMVFQSYALFPNMTVRENIAFGLKMKKAPNRKQKVEEMIERVHLQGKEDAYPHQLSGGQQQRVALARSLVVEPKVLLLDEPLSALDAKIRLSLQNELKRIQRELGMTTLFVTHDQEEAMRMSDTIHVMHDGAVVQSGTPTEIYTAPKNTFVARFIGSYNVLKAEDFKRLTGGELSGSQAAIRPEVLTLIPGEKGVGEAAGAETEANRWIFPGRIRDVTMMGSFFRYEVDTGGLTLHVDQLHRHQQRIPPGTPVQLSFSKNDLIVYP